METTIKKLDPVLTSDDQQLGVAESMYYRLVDIDPAVGYYAAYLVVQNFLLGDDYYIPTDFISGRDSQGRVRLTVSLKAVLDHTWSRMPDFIAHHQVRQTNLEV